MSKKVAGLLWIFALAACAHKPPAGPPQPVVQIAAPAAQTGGSRPESPALWRKEGEAILADAQKPVSVHTRARNLILFVGDGLGVSTVTAARILQGQQTGAAGEENQLSFEHFPATALVKTYNTDRQTAEAAGAMTAILTGLKTRATSIGLDQTPSLGQCQEAFGHEAKSLLETAKDAGLAAGVVSTMRITHAVPAATYAHVSDRDWETDDRMPPAAIAQGCHDIAEQLVEFDHHGGLDVVMGGGRLAFTPAGQPDPQSAGRLGARQDGQDLIAKWRARYPGGRYIRTGSQLAGVDWTSVSGPLLGLFSPDNMAFEADRVEAGDDQPSLTAMTKAAIAGLKRSPKGYVLLVDAGGIDRAHHAGNAGQALGEAIELSNAVQAAIEMTSEADTLIVVTADHGHTLTIGGYPKRGNPILGWARGEDGAPLLDARGRPYTTLAYANGPGAPEARAALPADSDPAKDLTFLQTAAVPMVAETHGGEDVPVYARGPGAQWVHGAFEQNGLYWIMQAALEGIQPPPAPPPKPAKRSLIPKLPKLWPFGKDKT